MAVSQLKIVAISDARIHMPLRTWSQYLACGRLSMRSSSSRRRGRAGRSGLYGLHKKGSDDSSRRKSHRDSVCEEDQVWSCLPLVTSRIIAAFARVAKRHGHGLDDRALHHHALNKTWEHLGKDYTLVTIPGVGHWSHHDAADLVTDTMKWWLAMRK